MTSLGMLQLVSPALPVGAFSYSEGLEWLIHTGKIKNESNIFSWLEGELLRGQIRIEAAAQTPIREALTNWKLNNDSKTKLIVSDLNSWLLALRDSSNMRVQQRQMGKSLLQLLDDLGHPLPDNTKNLSWTIAWGWAGLAWHLSKLEVIQGYLYSWVANQLSVAVRLLPLGPTRAQYFQSAFLPLISNQAELLLNTDPHQIWTGDVGATFAQLSHSELYTRLFRS
ncbi:urease accessory protein UreF [Prochlorococcus sp. MIT 1307]|uniref:urease accessory protein UreF n=1 Tax=Prochlorococcus sp. MIT 1307 TaxID=3096219 RepID=UPI002A750176|nr:urease accessory UreF family protein [Prochlorococcus sp. MIT 1307]